MGASSSRVSTCGRRPTDTVWLADAGSVSESPACAAVTVQSPTPLSVSTSPSTMQAPDAENVTDMPKVADATNVTGSPAYVRPAGSAVKSTVWLRFATPRPTTRRPARIPALPPQDPSTTTHPARCADID